MNQQNMVDLLVDQDGVISRRQVVGNGLDDNFIERNVRRRKWARVHRGVYVNHTGPPTWMQRAWAAVLFHWPAVLSHECAVYPGDVLRTRVIHVAIEHPRKPASCLPTRDRGSSTFGSGSTRSRW